MKYKNCSNCGYANPMENRHCAKCGAAFRNMIPKSDSIDSRNNNQIRQRKLAMRIIVGSAIVIVCILVLFAGIVHKHKWNEATCATPRTCGDCGETEGTALRHKWRDATCTAPITCDVCGGTEGVPLGHSWNVATCTSPATCQKCDATEPSRGHDWVEATCTEPQKCEKCSQTEGSALGHSWTAATYQQPMTCAHCKSTDGRSLAYPLIYCKMLEASNASNSDTDVQTGNFNDTFDYFHSNSLKFWVADQTNWSDTEYITYELDSGYELLEFTISAGEDNHSSGKTKFLIYANEILVYESAWIGNDTVPVRDTLDISGVTVLKIACTTDSPVFCYGIFDAVLYVQA